MSFFDSRYSSSPPTLSIILQSVGRSAERESNAGGAGRAPQCTGGHLKWDHFAEGFAEDPLVLYVRMPKTIVPATTNCG